MNRAVVPDWRTSSSALVAGIGPPVPSTVTVSPLVRISSPRRRRQSTIASVSSATKAPRRVLWPAARAAATRARLVMLFDPGGTTVAASGPLIGSMAAAVLISSVQASDAGPEAAGDEATAEELPVG